MIGIIGGSGIYGLPGLKKIDSFNIDTPFGDPSCEISKLSFNKIEFFFLPRHGLKHQFSPSKVNYRANIYAFKSLGVKQILSFFLPHLLFTQTSSLAAASLGIHHLDLLIIFCIVHVHFGRFIFHRLFGRLCPRRNVSFKIC